jgi:putative transposase
VKFRKSAHAIYRTEYHLVWIPRYRRNVFVKGVKGYAEKFLSHIPELDPDIEVVKLNVQVGHVHMVMVIPPNMELPVCCSISSRIRQRRLRQNFLFLERPIFPKEGIWYRGYCVSSIGLDEKEILAYIEHQEKEDKGQLQLSCYIKLPPAPAGGVSLFTLDP